jgi:BolA protein
MSERLALIETKLQAALVPESLDIIDDSHKHAGHAGSRGGAGHFDLTIVSDKFSGVNTVGRHRLVYDALSDMMPDEIHALSIKAFSPDEI